MKTYINTLALACKLAIGADAKAEKLPITDEKWVCAIYAKHAMGTFQELPEISCTLFDEGPGFHCSLTKTHLAYAKTLPELCYFPQGIVPECIRAYEHCELKHLQARDGTSAPDPRLFKKCVKDELEEFHGSLNQSKDDLPKKKH
ncbi:hypothetical protein PCL_10885 [Purpureocillium lilacinum]|uniref:Uncharacterized protein n=1 Tax=Purpureocillium lilacinum TaxID=33203 RepID=A0A2U3ECQ1_PURLI|nr:hypothetical protein PCL_10885 [Purpureocillium lilacinum]